MILEDKQALLFSAPNCGICQALKPKLKGLLESKFPKISLRIIDVQEKPELSARYQIFTVPVLLIYLEGKEFLRLVRSFSLYELEDKLERVYPLL